MDLRTLLGELGYAVAFRAQGWVECLLVHGEERWLGRGHDEAQALADAVRQMVPSHLGRVLLERSLAAEKPEPAASPGHTNGVPEVRARADGVAEPDERETLPDVSVSAAPRSTPTLLDHDGDEDEEVIAEVHELREKIEAETDELASSNPHRQRLVLLAWIARARSFHARSGADEVDDGVRAIASRLGGLAKEWWPGSVPALQIAARPVDAMKNLRSTREPKSWSDVASLAESELAALEKEERARGFDDFGWADGDLLLSRGVQAERRFEKLVKEIEELSGPFGGANDAFVDPSIVVRWANDVRAVRGAVEDIALWGRAIGRVRYMCAKNRQPYAEAASILDPAFRPHTRWAQVLASGSTIDTAAREAEQAARRNAELDRALVEAPTSDDRASICAWLKRTLPLTTDARHADVVERMRPFASTVLDLGVEDFTNTGRRTHKRLRLLQESLGGAPASSTAVEPPQSVPEIALTPNLDLERLRARAVTRTRGKRAVLVSNRIDRDLEKRLRELLELDVLDSEEADPRRVDAIVQAIGSRSYDIVLAATGFINHTVDGKVSRACRQAGVIYVRTNKARPTATLRALASF